MKTIYTETTLKYIAEQKGANIANDLVKQGTVKTIIGETKEQDINYLVIEETIKAQAHGNETK